MNGYKYNVFSFALDAAIDEEIIFNGGFVYIKDATDLTVTVTVRPDSRSNDAINLKKQFGVVAPFKKLFLTAAAQAGKTIDILVTDSFETFRIFEQAQVQDIGTVGTLSNLAGWGGTPLTGRDISADVEAWRKGHDPQTGTQVEKNGTIDSGIVILHTVTATKTLILENYNLNLMNSSVTAARCILSVRNVADVTQYEIASICAFNGTAGNGVVNNVKYVIPEGFDVVISGVVTSATIWAQIKGREV